MSLYRYYWYSVRPHGQCNVRVSSMVACGFDHLSGIGKDCKVLGVSMLSVSTILIFVLGIVPTVWNIYVFHFIADILTLLSHVQIYVSYW
jgi:hypothetical protein